MQRTFTDTEGRKWSPRISLYTAGRMKRQCSVSLEDIDSINEAIQDPMTRLDLLFLTIEDEAIRRNVSSEDFGKSLSGDSVKDATEALLYGIADFFEDPKKRTAFTSLIEAMKEEADKNVDYMIEKAPMIKKAIQKAGDTFRKELDKSLTEQIEGQKKSPASGKTSGSTPDGSA